jgi:hypothetical protein
VFKYFQTPSYMSDSGASELATRRALLSLFFSIFPFRVIVPHVGRAEQAGVQVSREAYLRWLECVWKLFIINRFLLIIF